MKLSELRPIVKEARRLGLKKVPKSGMWEISYIFYECEARFTISNAEVIYSNLPLAEMLNLKYKDFWKRYQEKFGGRSGSSE